MTAIGSLLILIVAIYLLAIVTDECFIPSLDQISQRFNLPPSVAGASLMAMGSSAPELSIALLALFTGGGEHSDLGIGTIVGSAVFNILVITGISAVARPAIITWRVIVRDIVIYLASIGLLLTVFADGVITLIEALSFLALYAIYLYILLNWKSDGEANGIQEHEETQGSGSGRLSAVNRAIARSLGVLTGDAEQRYVRAFVVSIVLIGLLSYVLVEFAIVFSDVIGIPPVLVALTILAGGTSIPDMLASYTVAKRGNGEMAIANAIGSNIFDILIGLGVPWALAIGLQGTVVEVGAGNIWTSTIILLSTVVLVFIFLTTEYTLSRREGWALLATYGAYVGWVWFLA